MNRIVSAVKTFCSPFINASAYDRTKWMILVAVFSAACFAAEYFFYANFRLGIDTQSFRCLDEWVYVINIKDRRPQRDKIFAIESQGAEPVIKNGMLMAKIIRGMPGDVVTITKNEMILINGKVVGSGMDHLHGAAPKDLKKFIGTRRLKEDEYWVMGTRFRSFDSRYYGPVRSSQIKGRAYGII